MPEQNGDVTELLRKWREGDCSAKNQLLELVLPALKRRARPLLKQGAARSSPAGNGAGQRRVHRACMLDAAVVGAPDECAGEIPMAFVVPKNGAVLEAADLMDYVAARWRRTRRSARSSSWTPFPKRPPARSSAAC
jgi:hypothetical protein